MDTSKKFCVWKPSLTSLSGGFLLGKYQNGTEIVKPIWFFKNKNVYLQYRKRN